MLDEGFTVRHRIDGLEIQSHPKPNQHGVRHRIDGLETNSVNR